MRMSSSTVRRQLPHCSAPERCYSLVTATMEAYELRPSVQALCSCLLAHRAKHVHAPSHTQPSPSCPYPLSPTDNPALRRPAGPRAALADVPTLCLPAAVRPNQRLGSVLIFSHLCQAPRCCWCKVAPLSPSPPLGSPTPPTPEPATDSQGN